jgi:hypothetical protein
MKTETHGACGHCKAWVDGASAHPSITRGYHISGLTELFPQNRQLPMLTPYQHLRELTDDLAAEGTILGTTTKGW